MDSRGHLLSKFARYFNRDMPTMSKQVKAQCGRVNKTLSAEENDVYSRTNNNNKESLTP